MMELYSYFRSSAAYRVRIALNLKCVEHRLVATNLLEGKHRSADYLAVNPQGLVPALKLPDGQIITQSPAILEWLEEQFPTPPLYPQDPVARAQVRAMAFTIACDIHPIDNLRVLQYLKNELEVNEEQKNAWYHHWIILGFSALEPQIKGPYSCGEIFTMADVYLIPQVYNALRFGLPMEDFPNIQAAYENCNKHPAFRDAHPDQQPDNTAHTQ